MTAESIEERRTLGWLIVVAAGVRAAFGIFVASDAYLKWQPGFAAHYAGYLQNAANGQPPWLGPWFHFWIQLVAPRVGFFVLATRLIETALAIGLLLGIARRLTYIAGALFSLLIWSTAEGFGGPYTSGATNLGSTLLYALVFVAFGLFESSSVPRLIALIIISLGGFRNGSQRRNGSRSGSGQRYARPLTGTINSVPSARSLSRSSLRSPRWRAQRTSAGCLRLPPMPLPRSRL